MKNTELLNIKNEFELTTEKLEEIKKPFFPLADEYIEFIPEITKVLEEKEITESLVKKAKRLKLDIASVRTKTKKLKDSEKAGVLKLGGAIQSCHNIIVKTIEEKEEALDKIVKHFENLEIERKKELRLKRIELLIPFEVENVESLDLGDMEESVFTAFLNNAKVEYDKKIEEKRKEEQRIKQEEEDNKKIRIENEKLKKEADEKEKENEKLKEEVVEIKQNTVEKVVADDTKKVVTSGLTEKQKEYIQWKKEQEGKYDIELKEDGKMVIYKKVGEFKI